MDFNTHCLVDCTWEFHVQCVSLLNNLNDPLENLLIGNTILMKFFQEVLMCAILKQWHSWLSAPINFLPKIADIVLVGYQWPWKEEEVSIGMWWIT